MNYTEFLLGPKKLVQLVNSGWNSGWECRNIGLLKIMTGVFNRFLETDLLNDDYLIRINTADSPSSNKAPNFNKFIEFQTSTQNIEDTEIFPDYIFGNWWHIGLRNFDEFTQEIISNSSLDKIEENKLFWIGNLQGIPQRIKYVEMAKSHPEKLIGEDMTWTNHGRVPTKFVHMKDLIRYKYLIDLTGLGCSGRLKLLPFCNRPLFITERRFWSWSDILLIKQNKHIKVNHNLDNLIEMYDWAETNQKTVFENSKLLLDWCVANFNFKNVCDVAFNLVKNAIEKNKNNYKINNNNTKIKFQIVVAHYKENLEWINRLQNDLIDKIFVYTKSDQIPIFTNNKVVHQYLPNVGRESQTYLYHCVTHYEDIQKNPNNFVFFVQGSPHGMDDSRIPIWMDQVIKYDLQFTKNYRISSPYEFLNKGRCAEWAGTTTPSSFDVKQWCENFVKKDVNFDAVPIFWNACFGLSAKLITNSEKNRYESMIKELSTINPECGHYCERLWYYIFNMDKSNEDVKVLKNCFNFWGGASAKRHHGIVKLNEDGTIGFYFHPNERYWELRGDSIVFMNDQRKPTSIMKKISENEYFGEYVNDQNVKHKLSKLI